jgi:hypothetical protein
MARPFQNYIFKQSQAEKNVWGDAEIFDQCFVVPFGTTKIDTDP